MKTCIVGAGAIGSLIGATMALGGREPTLIDRGRQLRALRDTGLTLIRPDGSVHTTRAFRTASTCVEAGTHDLVLLCVKAYDLPALAASLADLVGENTIFVTLQNGIPWWYFQRHGGPFEGTPLFAADPDGALSRGLEPDRLIGGVAYPAAVLDEPGTVRHVEGDVLALGELNGQDSERLEAACGVLGGDGLRARAIGDIRAEIWLKALGSASFNPLSALTGSTMAAISRRAEARELVRSVMEEAETIAGRLGIRLRRSIDERMAGAAAVGDHKTSMLQDLEAGRRLEIDALLGTVIELGRLTGTPTPSLDAIDAAVRLLTDGPPRDPVRVRPMREHEVDAAMGVLSRWNMAPQAERENAERSGIVVENAFVAVHGDEVVGTAGWFALSEDVAETASLAVDPAYRGLGLGYRLQAARLDAMRGAGFRAVRTETDRPATIEWYIEKFGYRKVGTNPKKHEFSLPDVNEWTVLELEL